jgi:ribosome modulation factor
MRLREDFDEAVDCVVRYLNQLDRLERATLRGYNAWATTQDGALYASNFQRNHGGWANVRDAAWEKLRRGSGG